MLLTRRHWLFGAAAALLVPERTIVLPPAGGWPDKYGYNFTFKKADPTRAPLVVNDVFKVTYDGASIRYYRNGQEIMPGDYQLASDEVLKVGQGMIYFGSNGTQHGIVDRTVASWRRG